MRTPLPLTSALVLTSVVALAACGASAGPSIPVQTLPSPAPSTSDPAAAPFAPSLSPSEIQMVREFADTLLGLPTEQALLQAQSSSIPARVVREDGVDLPATMDYALGRLNMEVVDGRITTITIEGAQEPSASARQ